MAVAYIAPDDPRRPVVAGIIMDRNGCGIAINWAYWLADTILGALDDLRVHDGRGNMTWADELDEPE